MIRHFSVMVNLGPAPTGDYWTKGQTWDRDVRSVLSIPIRPTSWLCVVPTLRHRRRKIAGQSIRKLK